MNAGQRTAELFFALLECQFPIDIPNESISQKTASNYAECLSVHIIHLNRVVKSTTERTRSGLITNRNMQESA